MTGLRRIRGLGSTVVPVAITVAVAVGALAGAVLGLAFPEPAPAPTARAVVPSPGGPALAGVLVPLDRARVRDRAALGRARTPREQAMLADRLADDHLAALTALRGHGGAPLADTLAGARHAYEALHAAAIAGSARRYGAARRAVQAAEARLTRAVDDALRPEVARVAAPIAASRPHAAGSNGLLDWGLIVGALAAGLTIGLFGPAGRSPVAAVPPVSASS
jgi:hypothetical protein